MLNGDSSTLSQLGLDNNCVVHCLVHQPRQSNATNPRESSVPPTDTSAFHSEIGGHDQPQAQQNFGQQQQQSAAEAGIDIGGLLVPLLGVILGLVWYCRIAYAVHFTATATTALVAFSGICICSVFAVWYPAIAQDA